MPLCKESDTVDGNWVLVAPHKPVKEALKMLGTSQLSRKALEKSLRILGVR